MSRPWLRARRWWPAGLLAAAVLASGCTGNGGPGAADPPAASASSSSPAPSSPAPSSPAPSPTGTATVQVPPAPEQGSCYRLSLEDAARPTSDARPVPCSSHHTARTIHVGRLDTIVDGHALGVDSDRVQDQLSSTCPKELDEFLGGSAEARALSRFQAIWFSPSLEEYDEGAMWFRCDVVALGAPDQLLRLPSDQKLEGVLDRPGALGAYGLCGTAAPGAPSFHRVACALPHSWVAISTIPLAGGEAYPGVAAVRSAGERTCSEEVRGRNGFVLEYRYGWEWPTADQWAAGQHYGVCWAPNDLA